MHELSIMNNILEIALEYAEKNNAKKIQIVYLTIGDLSDIIPQWAQDYFDMLSKDTIADKAQLIIDRVSAVIKCNNCNTESTLTRENYKMYCDLCNSNDITLLSGKELQIKSIDII